MNSVEPEFIKTFGVRAIIGKGGMSKATVETMIRAGATCLSVEAGHTLLFDRARLIERAWLLCFDEFQVTNIADAMLLGQILRNLVANALRYTQSGKILIGCRRRGKLLSIEVWDTGIGIRKEHQAAIFGEFFQLGNQARDRQHGLGLGLAIVERAARLIGAKISLRSEFGKGTCFAISLPISRRSAPLRPSHRRPGQRGLPRRSVSS